MNSPNQIDPTRRRRIGSGRLAASVALAVLALVAFGPVELLWTVNHPVAFVLAFPAGHMVFGLSVLLTKLSSRMAWHAMKGSIPLVYRPYAGETMLFYALLAFAEEMLFRALPLSHLDGSWWQVALLALGFTAIHIRRTSKSRLLVLVDFFVFACLLGALFVWTQDFWPLVIVHWVHNTSVAKVFVQKQAA